MVVKVDFGLTANSAVGISGGVQQVIPVPAAVWLFGSGLIGLVGVARRRA
ncbi:MAG: VPLPA-CTERM sorting domain-containing protein [Gammaproteobacteria bacterium]